ncbi:MAG: hypothetical protein IKA77_05355 [Clostridia bacterium]|nr:hypothetical protein [Clostridia bacterium]
MKKNLIKIMLIVLIISLLVPSVLAASGCVLTEKSYDNLGDLNITAVDEEDDVVEEEEDVPLVENASSEAYAGPRNASESDYTSAGNKAISKSQTIYTYSAKSKSSTQTKLFKFKFTGTTGYYKFTHTPETNSKLTISYAFYTKAEQKNANAVQKNGAIYLTKNKNCYVQLKVKNTTGKTKSVTLSAAKTNIDTITTGNTPIFGSELTTSNYANANKIATAVLGNKSTLSGTYKFSIKANYAKEGLYYIHIDNTKNVKASINLYTDKNLKNKVTPIKAYTAGKVYRINNVSKAVAKTYYVKVSFTNKTTAKRTSTLYICRNRDSLKINQKVTYKAGSALQSYVWKKWSNGSIDDMANRKNTSGANLALRMATPNDVFDVKSIVYLNRYDLQTLTLVLSQKIKDQRNFFSNFKTVANKLIKGNNITDSEWEDLRNAFKNNMGTIINNVLGTLADQVIDKALGSVVSTVVSLCGGVPFSFGLTSGEKLFNIIKNYYDKGNIDWLTNVTYATKSAKIVVGTHYFYDITTSNIYKYNRVDITSWSDQSSSTTIYGQELHKGSFYATTGQDALNSIY